MRTSLRKVGEPLSAVVIPPWTTNGAHLSVRRFEGGGIWLSCPIEGGEDGTPALALYPPVAPRDVSMVYRQGPDTFTQRVFIDPDGTTVRLWNPRL